MSEAEKPTPILSFKGFDKDLKCRGHQFEVGQTYTVEGKIEACRSGFHSCENPFDVWSYYPVVADDGSLNRYAEVEQSGEISRHDSDSKIASGSITIKAELHLPAFISRMVAWVIEATKGQSGDASGYSARIGSSGDSAQIGSSGYSARIGSSGDYAQIGSSGDSAQIGSSGYSARIGSSGDYAQIGSSGDSARIGSSGYSARIGSSGYSARIGSSGDYAQIGSSGYSARIGSSGDSARIGSSGDYAQIGSSGDSARIGSSGDYAQIGSSGDSARIGSSGDYAQIGSSGDSARIVAEGKNAVVASAGRNTTVSGANGAWVSIAEFSRDGDCVGFATGCIGKDGLKAGVAYRAQGGKLVEAGQ